MVYRDDKKRFIVYLSRIKTPRNEGWLSNLGRSVVCLSPPRCGRRSSVLETAKKLTYCFLFLFLLSAPWVLPAPSSHRVQNQACVAPCNAYTTCSLEHRRRGSRQLPATVPAPFFPSVTRSIAGHPSSHPPLDTPNSKSAKPSKHEVVVRALHFIPPCGLHLLAPGSRTNLEFSFGRRGVVGRVVVAHGSDRQRWSYRSTVTSALVDGTRL